MGYIQKWDNSGVRRKQQTATVLHVQDRDLTQKFSNAKSVPDALLLAFVLYCTISSPLRVGRDVGAFASRTHPVQANALVPLQPELIMIVQSSNGLGPSINRLPARLKILRDYREPTDSSIILKK